MKNVKIALLFLVAASFASPQTSFAWGSGGGGLMIAFIAGATVTSPLWGPPVLIYKAVKKAKKSSNSWKQWKSQSGAERKEVADQKVFEATRDFVGDFERTLLVQLRNQNQIQLGLKNNRDLLPLIEFVESIMNSPKRPGLEAGWPVGATAAQKEAEFDDHLYISAYKNFVLCEFRARFLAETVENSLTLDELKQWFTAYEGSSSVPKDFIIAAIKRLALSGATLEENTETARALFDLIYGHFKAYGIQFE